MSRMRMGLPTPVPPPQVTAKKTDVTRQGCPSAGAPQARPSLETSRAQHIARKSLQVPHDSFWWREGMFIVRLLASGNHLEMETGGNHDAGQELQAEGPRLCQPWGEASSGPGSPVPWAPAAQCSSRTLRPDTVRVHTRPTAPTGHLGPHHQLSPQPPPGWLPGGLCSLPALGPAGRSSAESTLLRNGAKGRPTAPLLPHPEVGPEPRAARLSCFEKPTSAVRGPPSSSLQNHPHPPPSPTCQGPGSPTAKETRTH